MRRALAPARPGGRFSETNYVIAAIAAFIFAPEIRRVVDWRAGFDPLNVFSVLPLVMILPIAFFVYRRRDELAGSAMTGVALVWTGAFAYALVIGIAQRSILPGIYGFMIYVLPLVVGMWFAVQRESPERLFDRVANALLLCGALAGAYGIVQYVFAPPWDTYWMQNIRAESFGLPQPFGIRVYSVMNGPGVYAAFTAFSLLINLPKLRLRNRWALGAMALMVAGLVLSLVRSAWLAYAIGVVIFAIASPRRAEFLRSAAVLALALAFAALAASTIFPIDRIQQTIANRIDTLGSVDTDASALDREQTSEEALASGLAEPFGHGLGVTGSSSALGSADVRAGSDIPPNAIDNGFLSRLVEMGFPGLAAFIAAIALGSFATLRAMSQAKRRGDVAARTIAAAAFATQAAVFLMMVSGDVYAGANGVVFFSALGLVLKRSGGASAGSTRPARRAGTRGLTFAFDARKN